MSTTVNEYRVSQMMKIHPRYEGETDVQYFARLLEIIRRNESVGTFIA